MPVLKCFIRGGLTQSCGWNAWCILLLPTHSPFQFLGRSMIEIASCSSLQQIQIRISRLCLFFWTIEFSIICDKGNKKLSQKMFLSASDSSCLHNVCSCSPVVSWGYSCHTTSSQYIQYIQYQNISLEKWRYWISFKFLSDPCPIIGYVWLTD